MRRVAVALLIGLGLLLVVSVWLGTRLTAAAPGIVADPPRGLPVEEVHFDGVSGWFSPHPQTGPCVLLMHGVRANRSSMASRARFLWAAGYSVLNIDLHAHGQSEGDFITFGDAESLSAQSAVRFLRQVKRCDKIASIGVSLGGAASVLGADPIQVDAYVLESVYPTIEAAVSNRLQMRLGPIGHLLAPLFYYQIPLRLDVPLDALRPIEALQHLRAPVLLIAGSEDKHTTIEESMLLYQHAPQPKSFWSVDGAAHVNFHHFDPSTYETRVLEFLTRHL